MFKTKRYDVPAPAQFPSGSASAALVSRLTGLLDEWSPQWREGLAEYAATCEVAGYTDVYGDMELGRYRRRDRAALVDMVAANPVALMTLAIHVNAGAEKSGKSTVVKALEEMGGGGGLHADVFLTPEPASRELPLPAWQDKYPGYGPGRNSRMTIPADRQLLENGMELVRHAVRQDKGRTEVTPLDSARGDILKTIPDVVTILSASRVLERSLAAQMDDETRRSVHEQNTRIAGLVDSLIALLKSGKRDYAKVLEVFYQGHKRAEALHDQATHAPGVTSAVAQVSSVLDGMGHLQAGSLSLSNDPAPETSDPATFGKVRVGRRRDIVAAIEGIER